MDLAAGVNSRGQPQFGCEMGSFGVLSYIGMRHTVSAGMI
jgi:hypothetical protein